MSSPLDLLSALQRSDETVADVLARRMALDLTQSSIDQMLDTYGEVLLDTVCKTEAKLRARSVSSYVDTIAKSHDPAAAAAAASTYDDAIADATAVRQALQAELVAKNVFTEMWNFKSGGQQRREVKRDANGRFARQISTNKESELATEWRRGDDRRAPKSARRLPERLEPAVERLEQGGSKFADHIDAEQQAKYQRYLYQVKEVDDLRRELNEAFDGKGDEMLDVALRVESLDGGGEAFTYNVPMKGGIDEIANLWDPSTQQAKEISYKESPDLDPAKARDVKGRLALRQLPMGNTKALDPAFIAQLGQLTTTGSTTMDNYDRPKLNRLADTTRAAAKVVGAFPKGGTASEAMQVLASGMESADQLREPMTRAAYRMRGTTKTPDQTLTRAVSGAGLTVAEQQFVDSLTGTKRESVTGGETEAQVQQRWKPVLAQLAADGERKVGTDGLVRLVPSAQMMAAQKKMEAEVRAAQRRNAPREPITADEVAANPNSSMVARAAANRVKNGERGDAAVRGAQRDAAAMHFLSSTLSRQAGQRAGGTANADGMNNQNIPRLLQAIASGIGRGFPSEGVILDSSGAVASQAVGMGEDHYLPFDLANYGKLNGGSYVRTRTLGGMTGEDIRTVLASNARAATVISGSGVFDIELDPTLRGKKRFNDKIARMPEMYERILDEIANGGHYAVDLSGKDKADIEQRLASDPSVTPDTWQQRYKDEETKLRFKQSKLTAADRQRATQEVDAELANNADRDQLRERAIERRLGEIRDEKVRELSINGEGYGVALQALQQYFPYAIKSVQRRDLETFASAMTGRERAPEARFVASNGADRFRVAPGATTSSNRPMRLNSRNQADAAPSNPAANTGADPTPAANTASGQRDTPAAPTKLGVVPDPGGNKKLDEQRSSTARNAARQWSAAARAEAGPAHDISESLENLFQSEQPDSIIFDNPAPLEAGTAFLAALAGKRGSDAIALLGTDESLREKVLSRESIRTAAKVFSGSEDAEQHYDDLLNEAAQMSIILAGKWSNPSEPFTGQPVMLAEFTNATKKDLDRFDSEPLAGADPTTRASLVRNIETWADLSTLAMKATNLANTWEQQIASREWSGDDPEKDAGEFLQAALDLNNAERDGPEVLLQSVLLHEATKQASNPNQPASALVTRPEIVRSVANAAVAQYSLMARRAALRFADDPKAEAASAATPMLSKSDSFQRAAPPLSRVSKADPLAMQVRVRRSLGLPLLPSTSNF